MLSFHTHQSPHWKSEYGTRSLVKIFQKAMAMYKLVDVDVLDMGMYCPVVYVSFKLENIT